ncbi:hybrid sensor histidine kinase/response regulator transcription factor [Brevibacillus reuszeri]|uniref:hybrid sensor histidine kinase/response regulator transcription factor n=1 Tax=Brevibacillus reuszeri TaxID=54915 RepID=UPI002898805B|nr:hybrid sensor histidine kinase/response regulator transcription factor [Brevibacillus reuszeri]
MLDIVKQWVWYDWVLLFLRLITCFSLTVKIVEVGDHLTLPLWIVLFWEIMAFSVPWICLLLSYRYYLITEMLLFGGVCLYLTSLFPEANLTFLMPAFMIAANSAEKSYRWSAPITIVFLPMLIVLFSHGIEAIQIISQVGIAYLMGFAFHLLIVNHRQNEIIRKQNSVLEQYLTQIERVTLLEERNRLSKDLHDTMGHSYTSIIMGLETLRPDVATQEGEQKLDSLLQLARKSMEEVRGYLHQMESPQETLPLVHTLRQVAEEFQTHANVNVRFRAIGDEYPVAKQVKMTMFRCLQESMTNAVRHGQATDIVVSLHFEPQQTRLEVQDNGHGVENWKDGFGITAMKERAAHLQGRVSIYSERGEGTLVTCFVPRLVESADETIRLLIVDDHSFIRESLRTILEGQRDLQVVGMAEDGAQALELCEELEPNLVLMDLEMPNMDGITATKRMKEKWPGIRVLVLSTFQDTEKAKEIMRSGADGYLLKSIESRELAETIRLVHRGGTMIAQDLFHKMLDAPVNEHEELHVVPKTGEKDENYYGLTKREQEILQMLSKGMRYKTIASKLYLSDGTVRNYASALYDKLGVRNRDDAIQKAQEEGLL